MLFLWITLSLYSLFAAAFIFFERDDIRVKVAVCAIALPLLLGVQTVYTYFVWALLRIYVSDLGVRCANFWGFSRFVAWDRVVKVRSTNLLGLRYFRIYDDGGWPLWLPVCMAQPRLFWPYLLSMTPPDSAIAQAVRAENLAN